MPFEYKTLKIKLLSIFSLDFYLLLLITNLFGFLGVMLGKDINWDLLNYHYYGPFSLVFDRYNYDIAPAQLQSYINPLLDFPFYWLVSNNFAPVYVIYILGCMHGISGFLLFILVRMSIPLLNNKFDNYLNRFLALLIGITGASGFTLIGAAMTGWEPSGFILAGLIFLFRSRISDGKKWKLNLIIAGLLFGMAAGLKLTCLSYVVAAVSTYLIMNYRNAPLSLSLLIIGSLVGGTITSGYWIYEMYLTFGNPIFPFMNNIFHSQWAEILPFRDGRFFADSALKAIFYPFYWAVLNGGMISELEFRDPRIAILFVLIPIILMKYQKISYENTFLAVFFIISYVLWEIQFSIYRYILPLELISGILIVNFLSFLINLPLARRVILVLSSVVIMLYTVYPNWGRSKFDDTYFKVTGLENISSGSLILFHGDIPVSYIVPTRPDLQFISINNNLLSWDQKNLSVDKVRNELSNKSRKKYIIYAGQLSQSEKIKLEESVKLSVDESCGEIKSNVGESLRLCRLIDGH